MAEAAGAHQGIVSLDMESFLEARRAYQVSESALPDFEKGAPQDVDIAKQAHDRKRYPLKPHVRSVLHVPRGVPVALAR